MIKSFLSIALISSVLLLGGCSSFSSLIKTATTDAPVVAMALSQTPAVSVLASDASPALKVVASDCVDLTTAQNVAAATFKGGAAKTVATASTLGDSVCHSADAMNSVASDPTTHNWLIGITNVLKTAVEVASILG